MTQIVTHARTRKHQALMLSCASAALAATLLMPQKAHAQAFIGTPTTTSGTVNYSRSTPGIETITIRSNRATINWTAANQQRGGGAIDFLPAGNTATFTSSGAIADYTVLNRIVPESGQPIALNGTVISTLQESNAPGGHIWFYAPGGIVVGATAVFNVGSLLLSTNDITSFGTTANGFNATFSGAAGSTSAIQIQNGAQINALQQNSYVALVAPRIEQAGKVRVNGSAAYVAGEQLSMTMNQGLFDIQVDVGTTDSNGVVHSGETSGPANGTAADHHKIYMVAVPKNQALTMLLGGQVGFDDAVSASVENGAILLSSGWGVHDSDGSGQYYNVNRGLNAGIDIASGHFTSDVTAWGQGVLQATAESADIRFDGNVTLNSWAGSGPIYTTLTADNGHHIDVAGDVNLLSSDATSFGSSQIVALSGGSVDIGGSASLISWNGTDGGDVQLQAAGGSINIGGSAFLSAPGNGGSPISSQNAGADSVGGSVTVEASNGGTVTTGDLILDASGHGQGNLGGGPAGAGYGGDIFVFAQDGALTVNGNLTAHADGIGGNATTGTGGPGVGGSIDIESVDGGSISGGILTASASATGGNGGTPGFDQGGDIELFAESWGAAQPTTLSFDAMNLDANGTRGAGGSIALFASGGAITADSLVAHTNGGASGGFIELGSDDFGSLQFGSVDASANGGDNGGFILASSGSGSTIDLGDASLSASGGFGGFIWLFAGTCLDCDGGDEFAAQAAALPAGGGIGASDLTLNTSGNIFVTLSGGADVSVSGALNGNAGQFISLVDDGTGGAIRAHDLNLSSITLDSNADIIADTANFTTASDMALGNVNAAQSATFTAGTLAAFNGTISSPTITVTSGDIDVGGSLGASGVTNLLTLNAVSNGQPIILGNGPAAPGQYHLGGEAGDIRATSVVINAQGTAPDVQVFDANIDGSATSGGGVTNLTLNTTGNVFVNGLVDWINAGPSDTLTINAGNSIQVNTDTGGIQITNGAGALAGTLALNANNVWVASGTVLDQLVADVNFVDRDTALGTNSGIDNPQGFIRAGTITAGVTTSFLVQNSGTPQLFAGIDTGAGGLSVTSTGTTPAILIIYGRQTAANGTVITNLDFVGSVDVGGTGGFTPGSSVNGCEIGAAASCDQPTFIIDMSSILGPIDQAKDDDDKKKDEQGDEGETRIDPALRLINTTPINTDHTINEPVTSGGDVVVGGGPVQPN